MRPLPAYTPSSAPIARPVAALVGAAVVSEKLPAEVASEKLLTLAVLPPKPSASPAGPSQHLQPLRFDLGETVYVAEVGHGARKGRIRSAMPGGMYAVEFDDGMPTRTCFVSSIFHDAKGANESLSSM